MITRFRILRYLTNYVKNILKFLRNDNSRDYEKYYNKVRKAPKITKREYEQI